MLQWYVYVPAVLNVRWIEALVLKPPMSVGVAAFGLSKPTLCATDPNAKVTVSPALIVSVLGENARLDVALIVFPGGGFWLPPPPLPPMPPFPPLPLLP